MSFVVARFCPDSAQSTVSTIFTENFLQIISNFEKFLVRFSNFEKFRSSIESIELIVMSHQIGSLRLDSGHRMMVEY